MPGSVMKGWLGMSVVVMIIKQLFSGRFSCEGKYDEVCCKFQHHAINPYQSYEARILFSTWNLDHRVEKSRTVIPGLVRAVQVVWRPLIGPDPFRHCGLIGWTFFCHKDTAQSTVCAGKERRKECELEVFLPTAVHPGKPEAGPHRLSRQAGARQHGL